MGEIRVNDIIYGTSFASGVTCDDNETVQEKLSNAAYLDKENEDIEGIPQSNYLYTSDIIDNLESESDTHVLSAKQGKILNDKIINSLQKSDIIDNLESEDVNKILSANQGRILNSKVEECFQSVSNGKALVASAITDKGIETEEDATFEIIANNISNIETGIDTSDGTAIASDILKDKVAYVKDVKVIGTMVNNGAKTSSLNCGGSYTIPAGYHNGSGKITANSLASQTSATATAARIQSGYTAWVNGSKITGTAKIAVTSQTGSFTFAVNPSTTTEYQVKFDNNFADTSYSVVYTVTSGYYKDYITMTTKTKLASGFTLNVKNSHTGSQATGTITWIAE